MQILGRNCRQKMVILSFLGYLHEIEPDSQNSLDVHMHYNIVYISIVCHGQFFQFSSPNLQWLTIFDFRNLLSAFWLAQLVEAQISREKGEIDNSMSCINL